ncbi:MAG: ankyrin repeat domain-containing protein, partial [Pirellulaceae bacterium]
ALVAYLDAGGNPNAVHPEDTNWTLLNSAIDELTEGGPLDLARTLVIGGACVDANNVRNDGAPLLVATTIDQIDAVKFLLEFDANPNVRDSEGDSPLRVSVEAGNHDLARLLLAQGARETIDDWGGPSAMTALGRAAWNQDFDMVELLLEFGANPDALDGDHRIAVERMTNKPKPEAKEIKRLLSTHRI